MVRDSITQLPVSKVCTHCHEEKMITEFSWRKRHKTFQSWCRKCVEEESKHPNKKGDPYENAVLAKLKQLGIWAVRGKDISNQYIDVIAWGCVRIEVKSATLQKNQFSFAFTLRQQAREVENDIYVLVCRWGDHESYHVFLADSPYISTNISKGRIVYAPNRKYRRLTRNPHPITPEVMNQSLERWLLIEKMRIEISQRLQSD